MNKIKANQLTTGTEVLAAGIAWKVTGIVIGRRMVTVYVELDGRSKLLQARPNDLFTTK